jgi:hypothetical protein
MRLLAITKLTLFPRRIVAMESPPHLEKCMLSAHEFATLMLVKDSADQIADREELGTLLERQLVAMERLASGAMRPRITQDGDLLLSSLARTR